MSSSSCYAPMTTERIAHRLKLNPSRSLCLEGEFTSQRCTLRFRIITTGHGSCAADASLDKPGRCPPADLNCIPAVDVTAVSRTWNAYSCTPIGRLTTLIFGFLELDGDT
ncbi:hypothetical protein PROFUN_00823 [Planoprotostelium fungivorum]|uniref:Uncharacterized protein n=1 Tax=Planoprotostelium fungivorum TaxID=1890364 RepID=A0A2P6P056_9EUKA|nr:hypothetical protein PROFUN_00823 [Planoprotostelium fungivorum]